jgi:hypothetical protein
MKQIGHAEDIKLQERDKRLPSMNTEIITVAESIEWFDFFEQLKIQSLSMITNIFFCCGAFNFLIDE